MYRVTLPDGTDALRTDYLPLAREVAAVTLGFVLAMVNGSWVRM